jgi:hypothetical protein
MKDKIAIDQSGHIWSSVNGDVIWSNDYGFYMNENQTAYFSRNIDGCMNGIVLQFQGFSDGAANWDYHYHFIPKTHAQYHNGGLRIYIIWRS